MKVGFAYLNGTGVEANKDQAKDAFLKAKELGETDAEKALKELF